MGTILPEAMVNILHNYGADRLGINFEAHSNILVMSASNIYSVDIMNRFSMAFTGEVNSPEAIWNSDLRTHLVEMIDQHLGGTYSKILMT